MRDAAEVRTMTEIELLRSSDAWSSLQLDGPPTCTYAASERLLRALEAHASAEAHDLAECQDLVQRSDDPYVKLLFDLIIDDEQRHQALLQSMVGRLHDGSEAAVAIPMFDAPKDPPILSSVELAAALRDLIRNEHEGARHLRHIGRQDGTVYDGLYSLLLEAIARDSEKHAVILRFLLARLERRPA
jgi:rubrerythrin